ncbi:hypothetical protein IAT40_004636 [Kwoniella sp. CBS 6097]
MTHGSKHTHIRIQPNPIAGGIELLDQAPRGASTEPALNLATTGRGGNDDDHHHRTITVDASASGRKAAGNSDNTDASHRLRNGVMNTQPRPQAQAHAHSYTQVNAQGQRGYYDLPPDPPALSSSLPSSQPRRFPPLFSRTSNGTQATNTILASAQRTQGPQGPQGSTPAARQRKVTFSSPLVSEPPVTPAAPLNTTHLKSPSRTHPESVQRPTSDSFGPQEPSPTCYPARQFQQAYPPARAREAQTETPGPQPQRTALAPVSRHNQQQHPAPTSAPASIPISDQLTQVSQAYIPPQDIPPPIPPKPRPLFTSHPQQQVPTNPATSQRQETPPLTLDMSWITPRSVTGLHSRPQRPAQHRPTSSPPARGDTQPLHRSYDANNRSWGDGHSGASSSNERVIAQPPLDHYSRFHQGEQLQQSTAPSHPGPHTSSQDRVDTSISEVDTRNESHTKRHSEDPSPNFRREDDRSGRYKSRSREVPQARPMPELQHRSHHRSRRAPPKEGDESEDLSMQENMLYVYNELKRENNAREALEAQEYRRDRPQRPTRHSAPPNSVPQNDTPAAPASRKGPTGPGQIRASEGGDRRREDRSTLRHRRDRHRDEHSASAPIERSKHNDEFVKALEEDMTCPVCMTLMVGPQQITPCGHAICGACGVQWIETRATTGARVTCPVCRHDIDPTNPLTPARSLEAVIKKWVEHKVAFDGKWEGMAEYNDREECWKIHREHSTDGIVSPGLMPRPSPSTPRTPRTHSHSHRHPTSSRSVLSIPSPMPVVDQFPFPDILGHFASILDSVHLPPPSYAYFTRDQGGPHRNMPQIQTVWEVDEPPPSASINRYIDDEIDPRAAERARAYRQRERERQQREAEGWVHQGMPGGVDFQNVHNYDYQNHTYDPAERGNRVPRADLVYGLVAGLGDLLINRTRPSRH